MDVPNHVCLANYKEISDNPDALLPRLHPRSPDLKIEDDGLGKDVQNHSKAQTHMRTRLQKLSLITTSRTSLPPVLSSPNSYSIPLSTMVRCPMVIACSKKESIEDRAEC